MHRRRRTALVLSAAIVAAAPVLTACGNDAHPGAAAVVGDQRITVEQLENRVNEVRVAQQAATADQAQYQQVLAQTGGLTRAMLETMVFDKVLDRALKDAGVTVTRRQVQEHRDKLVKRPGMGGTKGLEMAALQQSYVAPGRLDDSLRSNVELQELAVAFGADLTDEGEVRFRTAEDEATFQRALSEASKELGVGLNPRYGTWNVQQVLLGAAKTPWVREVSRTGTQQTT